MFESVHPSICLSACMFVHSNVRSHMRAFINACETFLISNFLLLASMFVLGCLPPYKHVCVRLSVRAYVPECIVCAYKHASVRMCACMRAYV